MSAVHDKSLAFLIHKEVFQIPKIDISQTKNKNMWVTKDNVYLESKYMTVLLERKKIQIQTRKDFLNFLCVFIFAYQIGKDSKNW